LRLAGEEHHDVDGEHGAQPHKFRRAATHHGREDAHFIGLYFGREIGVAFT